MSQCGLKEDPSCSSIGQLQRVLTAILKESSTKAIPLPVQLAALDSLLEICPLHNNPSSGQIVGVVRVWLQAQMLHPWGRVLTNEFEHKLQSPNFTL